MLVIIDANVCGLFASGDPVAANVLEAVMKGRARVVSGGKLKTELLSTSFRKLYRQLVLAGKLIEIDAGLCFDETKVVRRLSVLRSDDPHVLAVARLSGARVLFSYDADLCDDFRNRQIVPLPKGKILRTEDHVARLRLGRFSIIVGFLAGQIYYFAS